MAVAHVPEQFGVDVGSFNSVVWSDKNVCVPVPSLDVVCVQCVCMALKSSFLIVMSVMALIL